MHRYKNVLAVSIFVAAACAARAQDTVVPHVFDVLHYDAHIRLVPLDSFVAGDCDVYQTSLSDTLAHVRYDFVGLTADSVFVDGAPARFLQDSSALYVALGAVRSPEVNFHVHAYYHGTPREPAGEKWGGVFFGNPTYTIGVGFVYRGVSMTRFWMPCYDLPDDKATADVSVSVPADFTAASNGVLMGDTTAGGYTTYHWRESDPIATYLMCIAAGKYSIIRASVPPLPGIQPDSLPVVIYALGGDSAKAAEFFRFLPDAVHIFESRFGAYPFEKVGYALVPISGGMEHQSLIGFQNTLVYDTSLAKRTIAAHELSHQWFGDLVTPQEFREAWLSEGFATFCETIFYEGEQGAAGYLNAMHVRMNDYLDYVANPRSAYYEGVFPLYDFPRAAPSSNYPATIYYKGAAALGMLRWMLGDSLFFASMQNYLQQNQYGWGTTPALERSFEYVTGENLQWFFDEWVYRAGWPVLDVGFAAADSLYVTIVQKQDTAKFPLFRMPFEIRMVTAAGDTLVRRITMAAADSQVVALALPAAPLAAAQFDPDFHVLAQATVGRLVAVSEPNAPAAPPLLSQNFPNPLGRERITTVRVAPWAYDSRNVKFGLYDVLGRQVRDLTPLLAAHSRRVALDCAGLNPGVYYYILSTSRGCVARALTIAR